MIVAVDFDGVLFEEGGYPGVGRPILNNLKYVLLLQSMGVRLILWTCRDGEPLKNAVEACEDFGIEFVAVNSDDPAHEWNGPQSRKIYADYYIDDRSIIDASHLYYLLRRM